MCIEARPAGLVGGSEEVTAARWWRTTPPRNRTRFASGDVVCGDAIQVLGALKDAVADIIFLDPPFNLGKRYARRGRSADSIPDRDYFRFMRQIIDRSVAVLRPGGALYLYHLPKWAVRFAGLLHEELMFRHWIAVSMKNGFARSDYLYPAHYALLYYTKGDPKAFHRPKVPPERCAHCTAYTKDYGGYKRFVENGINVGDIWDDFSPVRHREHKYRGPNELPLDLLRRVVRISGKRGGVFVDPFAGTGASIVAAVEGGMRFIAGERESEYCHVISKRLRLRGREVEK